MTTTGGKDIYTYDSSGTFSPYQQATAALSANIMNGASRSAAVGRALTLGRALSASIMNGASRLATLVTNLAKWGFFTWQ
jgi:hypothetical protein